MTQEEKEKMKELRKLVESSFTYRMVHFGIKYDTKQYKNEQAAFFAGAGVIMGHNKLQIPPYWSICILSGRCIVEKEDHEKFKHEYATQFSNT